MPASEDVRYLYSKDEKEAEITLPFAFAAAVTRLREDARLATEEILPQEERTKESPDS